MSVRYFNDSWFQFTSIFSHMKVKRGIAILSYDIFLVPGKQTRGNEFILCWSDLCLMLKRFRGLKTPTINSIRPQSPYKHSAALSYRNVRENACGRDCHCDVITIQFRYT